MYLQLLSMRGLNLELIRVNYFMCQLNTNILVSEQSTTLSVYVVAYNNYQLSLNVKYNVYVTITNNVIIVAGDAFFVT